MSIFYPGRLSIIQRDARITHDKIIENFPSPAVQYYSTLGQMFKAKLFYQRFAFSTDFAGHDINIHGF
jgi:hypothetical protein